MNVGKLQRRKTKRTVVEYGKTANCSGIWKNSQKAAENCINDRSNPDLGKTTPQQLNISKPTEKRERICGITPKTSFVPQNEGVKKTTMDLLQETNYLIMTCGLRLTILQQAQQCQQDNEKMQPTPQKVQFQLVQSPFPWELSLSPSSSSLA